MHPDRTPAHRPLPRASHPSRLFPALLGTLLAALIALPATAGSQEGEPRKKKKPKQWGECADRYDGLAAEYREWIEEVDLLISDAEIATFLCLEKDYQRDAFIEQFWKVRDRFPDTARNEFKEQWESRLAEVYQLFDGPDEERARYYLLNGPAPIQVSICPPRSSTQIEAWFYGFSNLAEVVETVSRGRLRRGQFAVIFHRRWGRGPWVAWRPGEELSNLGMTSAGSGLSGGCKEMELELAVGVINLINRQGGALGFLYEQMLRERLEPIPPSSKEWVQTFTSYSTDIPDGAPRLEADVAISYPGRRESRTIVQMVVAVDVATASLGRALEHDAYAFELIGEVLRPDEEGENRLFETFRYRFEMPPDQLGVGEGEGEGAGPTEGAAPAAPPAPLVAQRYLRPGRYELVLRIDDLHGEAAWREQVPIDVPAIESGYDPTIPDPLTELFEEANFRLEEGEPSIRILAPPDDLVSGYLRFETAVTGPIDAVQFLLGGKALLRKNRAPFSVDLDLGSLPRSQMLRAIAMDAEGNEIASDAYLVNGSPYRFSVRLIDPIPGRTYAESVRARADLVVPEGKSLRSLEFFRNEEKVATLYQEPWVQPIELPGGPQQLTVVRVQANLEDGEWIEDTVLINGPGALEEVQVDFVELYTSVTDDQRRPVLGLEESAFTVLEDGVQQTIARFRRVEDTPLRGTILLDVSASMEDRIDQAIQAAAQFFEDVVTERDELSLIAFNDRPHVAANFTDQRSDFASGLLGLRAERGTSLYDSLIFALFHLNGLPGQRFVLLLSDGIDEHSRYDYEQALEYAQRSEAAIYAVGIDLPDKAPKPARGEKRQEKPKTVLERLAAETGGQSFFLDDVSGLTAVYASIAEELRSKYLLAYQSSNTSDSDEFRSIEVKVEGGGTARTLRGYYP
ncbi:MAG: VWA domain-containing protein [Acidobacteria bacterium]|nr:MAG: VWA domain-containing protein [Acidobacteriota bacterium]REK06227.1 MAG: VWA domain-containing protein [Acidobacteriota bacterium]